MGSVGAEPGEERLIMMGGDEFDGGVGEDVGAIAAVFVEFPVVEQHRIEIGVAGRIGGLGEAAAFADKGFLKAMVAGAQGIVIAQVPLAEDAGDVTGCTQDFGESDLVGVHHGASQVGIDDAGAVIVAPREQGRPGW